MSKILNIFLSYSFLTGIFFVSSCGFKKPYVSIDNNKIQLNGSAFYPVAINYMTSINTNSDLIWVSPYGQYFSENEFQHIERASNLLQFSADMELIKEMGFNTVRIVVFGEEGVNKNTGEIFIVANLENGTDSIIYLSDNEVYRQYFRGFSEMIGIINTVGLKAILLIPVHADIPSTVQHFIKVASHFRNDTTIIAYDLFNEPLYFDSLERKKEDVYLIVKKWKKMVRKYAPNHLFTVGLSGIREVFEWDPNLLDVDFISFHPYEYEPEQVRNEMCWYHRYVKKPWMIGETSVSADDNLISYEMQKVFAHKTLKQAFDCGAIGYSWWQYKDVDRFLSHQNNMGVVNKKGESKTASGKIIKGTQKPVNEEFRQYQPSSSNSECLCLENYYNYSQHKSFRLKGILYNHGNNPIDGGVILAWNQWWNHSYHTITKPNGSFELLSDYPFYHWMASATGYSRINGNIIPDSAIKQNDSIPTLNIGIIKIKEIQLNALW